MNRLSALVLLLTACGSTPSPTPEAPVSSDAIVYVNARVLTLDAEGQVAAAVRTEGGRITHLLDPDDATEGAAALSGERVDLGGATILPGLVDAHLHLRSLGRTQRSVDLLGTESAAEVIERVRAAAESLEAGQWILGRGWDQNDWAERTFPTHEALSRAIPEHPVWLVRVDGHAVWVNAPALALASPDALGAEGGNPDGGEILRGDDGAPTGVFIDNAMEILGGALPQDSPTQIRADLRRAMELCAAAGITGVHDMGVGRETLAELQALEAAGDLPLRVTVYLAGDSPGVDGLLDTPPDNEGLLRVVGVKYFSDGALGSRGAALFDDYDDRPGHRGLLVLTTEELTARARRAHAAGYQLAIHAIGDHGVASALDAIAAAQGEDRSLRHRIEHVQVIRPEDVPRLSALGVVASMQPKHATSDMPWAEERVGPVRIRGAYAWRTVLGSGAIVAFGSDAPVEDHRPALGLYAATTRQDGEGQPAGGWYPDERLTITEALGAFTDGPARAVGREDLGVIRVGAAADLTFLRRDPTQMSPGELLHLEVLGTVVAGHRVGNGGGHAGGAR